MEGSPFSATDAEAAASEDLISQMYKHENSKSTRGYAGTTLFNLQGALTVDGLSPPMVKISTGTSAVVIGRSFASQIRKCHKLVYGDTLFSAGKKEDRFGRTEVPLEFVLAKGTPDSTCLQMTVFVGDTDSYDVVLGMDFLGPCYGYVDPLTEEFVWMVDCHDKGKMPTRQARLRANCHRLPPEP